MPSLLCDALSHRLLFQESDEFQEMRKEQQKMLRKANRRDKKGTKVAVAAN